MSKEMVEKTCEICGANFMSSRELQKFCSYDCYKMSRKTYNKEYYAKLREAGIKERHIICKNCHTDFTVKNNVRQVYCSYNCYHEACLEKNREWMQRKRAAWKEQHPTKTNCEICGIEVVYARKKPRWCEECRPLAKRIKKQWGDVEVPGAVVKVKSDEERINELTKEE